MKKLLFASAFLCLALSASIASAAGVELSDAKAGYTVALPEGWAKIEAATLKNMAENSCPMVSGADKENMANAAQGAELKGATPLESKQLIVLYIPNKAMDIGAAELRDVLDPKSATLADLKEALEAGMAQAGIDVGPSLRGKDNFSVASFFPIPDAKDGMGIYQIMQMRFTKENLFIIIGMYPGKQDQFNDKAMLDLINSLTIDSAKAL